MAAKQQIILEHLNGTSNREIARSFHISKDTVNKYVNEYDRKREELTAADPEADISEIIQDFVSAPKYKKRIRLKKTETLKGNGGH